MRFFNTEGPINAEHHYCVPPLSRIDLDEVLTLIRRLKYLVLHAPRQTGKTTVLGALLDELNGSGRYRCVYGNVDNAAFCTMPRWCSKPLQSLTFRHELPA